VRGFKALPGIGAATGVLLLAWPFIIWFGLRYNSLQWLLPLMAVMLVLRLRQVRQKAGPMRFVMQSVALAGIVLCIASILLKTHQLLLFYPVVVNIVMLTVFGGSLWTAMPLVERVPGSSIPRGAFFIMDCPVYSNVWRYVAVGRMERHDFLFADRCANGG
jgi:uncharacterized membrane protein